MTGNLEEVFVLITSSAMYVYINQLRLPFAASVMYVILTP